MRSTVYFILALLIIALLIGVRWNYNIKVQEKRRELLEISLQNNERYFTLKKKIFKGNRWPDRASAFKLKEFYDEDNAWVTESNSVDYAYIHDTVQYHYLSERYIDRLRDRIKLALMDDYHRKMIDSLNNSFQKQYPEAYQFWKNRLDRPFIDRDTNLTQQYSPFFQNVICKRFEKKEWKEYGELLRICQNLLDSNRTVKENLIRSVIDRLAIHYNKEDIPSDSNIADLYLDMHGTEHQISFAHIGNIVFSLSEYVLNEARLQEQITRRENARWSDYQLRTGDMPYSEWYGSVNSVGSEYYSQIEVTTSSTDMVVLIKDIDGRIIRHAYIRATENYLFTVNDGSYKAFFYSGKGWNPNKEILSTNNVDIRGGFVTNEDWQTDEYFTVNSQIMRYTMRLIESGNLRTKNTNSYEVFN